MIMRVNLVMNDDLVAKLDEAASLLNISRSAYICMAVSQKIQQDVMMSALPDMLEVIKAAQTNPVFFSSLNGEGDKNNLKGDLTNEGKQKE